MNSPESKSANPEALMKQLAEVYLSESRLKMDELKSKFNVLQSNPRDLKAATELTRLFHNLAGSGASYGFPAISELAKAAEDVLRPVADGKAALSVDTLSILSQ